MIFLPGIDQQAKFLYEITQLRDRKILIIGSGTAEVAQILNDSDPSEIIIIVRDYESLISLKYEIDKSAVKNVKVKMMDFDNTDFKSDSIDIIYGQGSISGIDRNKIVKETKRILKSDGIFCTGEIVSLKENPPAFIKDIWQSSDLLPLMEENVEKYYQEKGFEIINQKDLSYTLKDFYVQADKLTAKGMNEFNDQEKSYYKKILKKLSHESNVFLKMGGDEYMGFKVLIMRKKSA